MNRLIILAALLLSVVGGLTLMSSASPLAAQTSPSATRSFDAATVAPDATVTVTLAVSGYGGVGRVTETLPSGFAYMDGSLSATPADTAAISMGNSDIANGVVAFNLLGASSISYQIAAASADGDYTYRGGTVRHQNGTEADVDGAMTVTVATDAPPPPPGPLVLPDLDSGAEGLFSAPADSGNDVSYTAASDDDDAKVSVRVGPDAMAIVNIDLGDITVPEGKEINFSLTDGSNLPYQVKKITDTTAEIVVKSGSTATTHAFQLVVNELGNAPANTQDIIIDVTVVIDNAPPVWTSSPATGTVAERAAGGTLIATFSASDVNNQVLSYSISGNPSWVEIGEYNGELRTTSTSPMLLDYDEDNPDDNDHPFTVSVTDGTESVNASFTLTVTDVEDPARGEDKNFNVPENTATGGVIGTINLPGATGNYAISEQFNPGAPIDQQRVDGADSLFQIADADGGANGVITLIAAGTVDFEDNIPNNYVLVVQANGADSDLVTLTVTDVNEAPYFSPSDIARDMPIGLFVLESATVGTTVSIGQDAGSNPTSIPAIFTADDDDSAATGNAIAYDLWDEDGNLYGGKGDMFTVNGNGTISVNAELDTDADDAVRTIDLTLRAVDAGEQSDAMSSLANTLMLRVTVIDTNVAPEFDAPSRALTHATVSEGAAVGTEVHTYRATDEDGDTVGYRLRDADDAPFFSVQETTNSDGEPIGILRTAAGLDYEMNTSHTVEIQAFDTDGDTDEIAIEIQITNENDETPAFTGNPLSAIPVQENSARGMQLGNSYAASDPDGFDISYSLSGDDADSFMISDSGVLMTLESLDYDRPVPCGGNICNIVVNANDGAETLSMAVAITVTGAEDSVSTVDISKANPVPGTTMGNANSALAGTKTTYSAAVPERPADLPATQGDAPMNFVETEWGSWGTVLRIEVTAQSPDATCGNGNQCVVVNVNSDSADDTLKVQAYRSNSQENKFVAAVELVELEDGCDKREGLRRQRHSCVQAHRRRRACPAG